MGRNANAVTVRPNDAKVTPAPWRPGMTHPEMSAPTLALSLRRLRRTRSVPALHALADEIERE